MATSTWRLLNAQIVRRVLSPGCVVAHIGVFLVSGTILVLANAIGSPGTLWFWRPLLILSAILALHATAIVAAGRTSRLRAAAAWAGSVWTQFWLARPDWARGGTLRATVRSALRRSERELASPVSLPVPGNQPAVAPPPDTSYANAWSRPTPTSSAHGLWPAVTAAGQPVTTWRESAPAWAASWPTPPSSAASAPVRPTGYDRVLAGVPVTDPDNPRWDQLEVAATTWLAHRTAESAETVR